MLERSKLVKMNKMVNSQNVDFRFENVKVWLLPNEHFSFKPKLVEKSNILSNNLTNSIRQKTHSRKWTLT